MPFDREKTNRELDHQIVHWNKRLEEVEQQAASIRVYIARAKFQQKCEHTFRPWDTYILTCTKCSLSRTLTTEDITSCAT